ncbi:MAG: energy transducer TonB [Deferrisomatales bacterium]|nr:energy transducer TonB [Deferrisomatales bacterium]
MSARVALALALGTSLILHLAVVLFVPPARVRLLVGEERLVEVELHRPLPPPLPLSPPAAARPAPPAVTREALEALAPDLLGPQVTAGDPPLPLPPLRLPTRRAELPEPDTVGQRRFWSDRVEPLPERPGLLPARSPAPEPPAATDVAQALLRGVTAPGEDLDAAAREAMRRLEIEGPVGLDRRVVREPPPPQVPIRHPASVAIRFYVSPEGDVGRAYPTERGDPELDHAALEYIKAFRFNALPPGEEREQWGTIRVRFRLE